MHKYKVDYDKHCQISFGAYVQALNNPKKNTQSPRAIDAIYLTLTLNKQGGHVVVDYKYGLTFTIRKVPDIPVNNLIIKDVEEKVSGNKIATLQFENNSGVLLHPNDWLKGVDYGDEN